MKKLLFVAVAAVALSSGAPAIDHTAALDVLRITVLGANCGPGGAAMNGPLLQSLLQSSAAFAQSLPDANAPPPLMPRLGDAHLPITTTNPQVQAYFDQGVRLMHGFNHAEALRSFRYAQTLDPNCAMCFWGEAMALGPNINADMDAENNAPVVAAMLEAAERADRVSAPERALIQALQTRFTDPAPESRSALDAAYADAMIAAAARFVENDFINVFAADAIMASQPWDYWEADGITPKGRAGEAIAHVERVIGRSPNDAGAIHLYIHLTEASRNPWLAEQAAERLDRAGLLTGHLQHMPGHTYARIGRFRDSVRANIAAVTADETYLANNPGASRGYRYGYYPHNIHFVMAGAAMGGDARTALRYAERLDTALPYSLAESGRFPHVVKAQAWFVQARFETPANILRAEQPPEAYPFMIGAWRYARVWAQLRSNNVAEARAEYERFIAHRAAATEQLGRMGMLLDIYGRTLLARILMAEGDHAGAVRELQAAVTAQADVPYSEPTMIYYPVGRTLGAAHLRNGQFGLAEQAFMQSLIESPNDAYAYWGLAEARRLRGDRAGANAARAMFRAAYMGGSRRVTLQDL